jgi:hypothetical protein
MLNQYRDVFRCLRKHDVRYVVIGGIAAVLHGVPRVTFDLDLLIQATEDNASRLLKALREAGLGTASLTTTERLLENEITIFKDRLRIDVQTRTPGLEFDLAWEQRESMQHQDEEFHVVCVSDLIASKVACGREVDLSDVAVLRDLNSGSALDSGNDLR